MKITKKRILLNVIGVLLDIAYNFCWDGFVSGGYFATEGTDPSSAVACYGGWRATERKLKDLNIQYRTRNIEQGSLKDLPPRKMRKREL